MCRTLDVDSIGVTRLSLHAHTHTQYQWRRKVPKSGGGGGGTQIRNLCTFGKEPI